MVVVPLPHPDSTVPRRGAPCWLVPLVGALSGPSVSHHIQLYAPLPPCCHGRDFYSSF